MASNELDRKGAEDQGTNGGANFLQPNGASGTDLSRQISVTLTPEQFESLYLQPSQKSRQQGELIKALGNPTGLGVICFIFNLLPTSCILMGFRGLTAPAQVPILGVYYFVGGLGMTVAGVLEFVIGNTFPFIVFFTFGVFWLSLGALVDPLHLVTTTVGSMATDYYGGVAFYLLTWAIFVFMLTIAGLRTNIVLTWILFFVAMTFTLLSAGYFRLAEAATASGTNLLIGAGAMGFAACMGGLYLEMSLLLG